MGSASARHFFDLPCANIGTHNSNKDQKDTHNSNKDQKDNKLHGIHLRIFLSTVNSTMMARGTYGIDTILQPTIFMKQKRMSEEVSRESTCPHVSLIVCINVILCCVFVCTSRQCLRKWDALHWCKEARDCNGGRSML
ncbi:hypothetical protein Bca4012_042435 [Brassica carinata]